MTVTADCCDASGGRVVITAGGVRYSARAAVQITPYDFERSVIANQDGTLSTQVKPQPPEAEITLADQCGLSLDALMSCPIDVTIDLIDMKRKYLFTKGYTIGRPSINSETGEIRGLKVTSRNVSVIDYN